MEEYVRPLIADIIFWRYQFSNFSIDSTQSHSKSQYFSVQFLAYYEVIKLVYALHWHLILMLVLLYNYTGRLWLSETYRAIECNDYSYSIISSQ